MLSGGSITGVTLSSLSGSLVGNTCVSSSPVLCVFFSTSSSGTLDGAVLFSAFLLPPFSLAVESGVAVGGSFITELFLCFSTSSGTLLSLLSAPFSSSSSSSSSPFFSPSSSSPFPPFSPPSSDPGLSVSEAGEDVCSVAGVWRVEAGAGVEGGGLLGHTELGKEEMTPPLKPKPARRVLVTTDATVAWLPLEEGPIPVAIDTKEKGRPEEVQVEEPELIGAMSAEEAGETVG